MKLYDVLNDYSLKLTNEVDTPTKWVKAFAVVGGEKLPVELGYSKKHNELIFLKSEQNLDGKGIYQVDFT